MDTTQLVNPFFNGYWGWDDLRQCLQFISRDPTMRTTSAIKQKSFNFAPKSSGDNGMYEIKFRDVTDKLEKLIFRRYFQRRVKPLQPDVITVQDLRDIALYLANPKDLSIEFVNYFHISPVDRFLRALIIYFQYFLDVFDVIELKRDEAARKIRQPVVFELEDIVRDNLEDLRALLAREYLVIIGGVGEAKKFHHMAGRMTSLSGKDRRLFEMLMQMAVRVVWIALYRKHLNLIVPGGLFNNGYWIWDESKNSLSFIKRDGKSRNLLKIKEALASGAQFSDDDTCEYGINFRDVSDKLDKIIFKRYFQRHVKLDEPNVITVQDLKDIALYLANPKELNLDFILFIHTRTVDKFFRSLIIYFQCFLDIWERMLQRRVEEKGKLRQPVVLELEDLKRDDLSDLRAMVARDYLAVIAGLGDAKKYHHLKGTCSLSDKDRKLYEKLYAIAARIVWIGLQRKHLHIIELEMNRMFRGDTFNLVSHRKNVNPTERNPEEDRVLLGAANLFERKLLQRSPVIKELIFAEHDHRLLGAGVKVFQPRDDRIDYIEAAYSAPEEHLNKMGIALGLLGIPREEFDPVLVSRERTSKTYTKKITEIPDFTLPPRTYHSSTELPSFFPKEPGRFEETPQSIRSRKIQCKMWVRHVRSIQLGFPDGSSDRGRQESSSRISIVSGREDEAL